MTFLSSLQAFVTTEPFPILILPTLLIIYYIYQTVLHPLGLIPGPLTSKLSSLPLVYQCRQTRKSKWVLAQHAKFGPIVRIAPNYVSITDPVALDQIYGSKSEFPKGRFYQAFHQVEPVLFNTRDAEVHNRKWKLMNAAFSPRNLNEFEVYMDPHITSLVKRFQSYAIKAETFDFQRWANFLAFDVMGEWSFGSSFGFAATGKDIHNLITTLDVRSDVLNVLGHLPLFIRPYMKHFPDPFFYNGLRVLTNLGQVGTSAFKKRLVKKDKGEDEGRKDFMGFLLNATDPDTGGPLRMQEVVAEAISFIGGGSHTTSVTMAHVMDFVSRDQGLQDEIWRELCIAFPGERGEDWVANEQVASRLPLLNAVLKEVMRIRPTSSTGLERAVPEGGRMVAGVFLPGGTLVSVPIVAIHHDESVYEQPEIFDPHRWLRPEAKALTDYYIPFSIGSRGCAGKGFAMMEMNKTFATLLRRFKFERAISKKSEEREGFVVKIMECEVKISLRSE
ncbi:cytochrome P450 [Stipitochalara longipes BDJ]|nr:cytochrome P450 [Stipitochalara longipes BDJ]